MIFISGCDHDDKENVSFNKHIGNWKTFCFSDDVVPYWVITEYEFTEEGFRQIVFQFEDSDCTNPYGASGLPGISEGTYRFKEQITSTSGLDVEILDMTWFHYNSNEVSWRGDIGIYVDNDVLYIANAGSNGLYEINFDVPFYSKQ